MSRYRQAASHVAIWGVAVAVILLLGLAGCQSRDNHYTITAYDGATVRIEDRGDTEQDRGGQQTEALREPNVSVIP